jgi:hypothetical protein
MKLCMGDMAKDDGDWADCEVEGLEFSGLHRALTTDAHSLGLMNDWLEFGVDGRVLNGLPFSCCFLGDDTGDA